jgi:hypothetical protein
MSDSDPAGGAELAPHQADILAALRVVGAQQGWRGESLTVEDALVYQTPLPEDPDVSGALFVVEPDEPSIRLYLTLPGTVPPERRSEAAELAARAGYGRRFGALELDLEHGTLRVRADGDATEDTVAETIARVFDRAMTLARDVSPAWRQLASRQA